MFSPHPKALSSTSRTLDLLIEAAKDAGAPEDIISYLHVMSSQGTRELMCHKDTSLILANTNNRMAAEAHRSGKPTINGGPGNGPAFIEKTADIERAVSDIIFSKTFDNGLLCSAEESIVVDGSIADKVEQELIKHYAYFMNNEESNRLGQILFNSNGKHNMSVVGKSAKDLAIMAGFEVPDKTSVLISREQYVSASNPYCKEKLCPVLAFFIEQDWMFACEKCIELLITEGKGHTLVIHSNNESVIREFALKKPVSRMLVNTSGSLGGIGLTTNLPPTLVLSTGTIGGGFTADNISPLNLINVRKVGYGVRSYKEVLDWYMLGDDDTNRCINSALDSYDAEFLFNALLSKLKK